MKKRIAFIFTMLVSSILLLTVSNNDKKPESDKFKEAYRENFVSDTSDQRLISPTIQSIMVSSCIEATSTVLELPLTNSPTPTILPTPTNTPIIKETDEKKYERLKNEINTLQKKYNKTYGGVSAISGDIISTNPFIIEGVGTETLLTGKKVRYVILNPEDGNVLFGRYSGTHKFVSKNIEYEDSGSVTYMVYDEVPSGWKESFRSIESLNSELLDLEFLLDGASSKDLIPYQLGTIGCRFDYPSYLGRAEYVQDQQNPTLRFISKYITLEIIELGRDNPKIGLAEFNSRCNDGTGFSPYKLNKYTGAVSEALILKRDEIIILSLLLKTGYAVDFAWTYKTTDTNIINKLDSDIFNIVYSLICIQ
jgi:hypothetical protein